MKKINWLKVVEGVALVVGVGVTITQGIIADRKLDNKITEQLAERLENK